MRRLVVYISHLADPNPYHANEWAYYRLPALVIVIDVVLSIGLAVVFSVTDTIEPVEPIGVPILSLWFIPFLLLVSTIEELLFRIIPLSIAMSASERKIMHVLTALIAAMLFGYVHGGWANVPLQGIGGFLYGLLFIRYARGGEAFLEASIVVIMMHTAFNGLIGMIALLGGETMF